MNSRHDRAHAAVAYAQAGGCKDMPPRFFTIPEVAESLAVSARTVRRWIKQKKMVAHYFGAPVRIAESDLNAFIAQHRRHWRYVHHGPGMSHQVNAFQSFR